VISFANEGRAISPKPPMYNLSTAHYI